MSKVLNKQKLERARSKISRKWNEQYLDPRVEQDAKEYVY